MASGRKKAPASAPRTPSQPGGAVGFPPAPSVRQRAAASGFEMFESSSGQLRASSSSFEQLRA
eukprot:15276635-Alexandrium_andersonii.AAC.1